MRTGITDVHICFFKTGEEDKLVKPTVRGGIRDWAIWTIT